MVLVLGASHPASRRQFLFARVAIFAGIVITAVAASPLILKRLYEADPTSVQYRLEWIQTAKAMILDNPVFGVGLNTYVYMQVPYGKNKTPGELTEFYGDVWPVVHNAWLIVWSEQGTIGFIIWIAFHISVIAVAIRNLRIRDPMMHALGVGLFAGFVAIMIDGLASFFVREEATSRMFWIATAMILAIGYWRRLNEDVRALTAAPVAGGPRQSQVTALPDGRWLPARESLLR
jgi:O-antigen ligase